MSHVVLCVHAVMCGLASVHRVCMVCKDLCVRPVFSHNYGGHLLCVAHFRVIDGLVNKRLYTVYVQLVCSILLILHTSLWRLHTVTQLQTINAELLNLQ